MLSYRHAFHAGNHADLIKHLVLVNTLQYAMRKEAPLFYLDTHAGAGLYHLQSEQSLQTGEAALGVLKLDFAAMSANLDGENKAALELFQHSITPFLERHTYPGSPLLAASLLRKQDHLELCELHPVDFELLVHHIDGDRRAHCEQIDGYKRARALLPPAQKRAVVLIDPSYELKEDYRNVIQLIADVHQRMQGAQILLWYPVVERGDIERMQAALARTTLRDVWQFELGVAPDSSGRGLTASGMLVVNPPYTLPGQLRAVLPLLQQQIAPAYGHWLVRNLIGE